MAVNFLDLIGTFLNDRARAAALAAEQQQFEQRMALDRERFGEEKSQFGRTFDQRKVEADRGYGLSADELALNKNRLEQAQLMELAGAVGRGANNMPQADILSLIASRNGIPINKAALRNTMAAGATRTPGGYGGGGESGVANAIRGLGQVLVPGLDWENRGGTWTTRRYGFPS